MKPRAFARTDDRIAVPDVCFLTLDVEALEVRLVTARFHDGYDVRAPGEKSPHDR